jgi:hypothetical protein
MSDSHNTGDDKTRKDDELAALLVAGSIIAFFVVYWAFEIQSVRELLEMAYG